MKEIPFAAYLLCDSDSLFDYEHGNKVEVDDIKRRLLSSARKFDVYQPDYVYKNAMDLEFKDSGISSLSDLLVYSISSLSEHFLEEVNGAPFVKKELLEEWMGTMQLFPPLLIDAAFYLNKFHNGKENTRQFFFKELVTHFGETAQRIPYLFELDKLVREGLRLNDLHVHLNGTTETDFLWWAQMGALDEWIGSMESAFISNPEVKKQYEQLSISNIKILKRRLYEARKIIKDLAKNVILPIDTIFRYPNEFYLSSPYPVLARGVYFYMMILLELENSNDWVAGRFHYLILILGSIHHLLVQQRNQKGFTQFGVIPQNDLRYNHESKEWTSRFKQLSSTGDSRFLEYLEGRFSPKETTLENLCLIDKIKNGFGNFVSSTSFSNNEVKPRLGLVAHFIKKPDRSYRSIMLERHHALRKELYHKAIALLNTQKLLAKKTGLQIVGIDAASNEMDAGPEVFSQMFRFMRRVWKDASKLRITFHAGEDFVHLLSGLRCMYESAVFLDMEQGDRIGHGTAAGIDPALWRKRIGNIICIRRGEWLDDLLFVYQIVKTLPHPYDELRLKLPALSDEIRELSAYIYPGNDVSLAFLESAWKCRKYEPEDYVRPDNKRAKFDSKKEIKECRTLLKIPAVKSLYEAYHYGRETRDRYDELINVGINEDLFSVEDLRKIQNIVLDFLARKGIALEVQFSSNLCISFYKEAEEHHLERWLKQESELGLLVPPVVLGSDDPGIFMTNIYIEYARVMSYLEDKGYNLMDRISMVDKLFKASRLYRFE